MKLSTSSAGVVTARPKRVRFPILWAAVLSLVGGFPGHAQPPAFEVASIHLTPSDFHGSRAFVPSAGNNLSLQGMSLKELLQLAYTLPSDLVTGGPGWIDDTRYDIEARAEGKASQQQRLEMLKTLLSGRFKLAFHFESKETSSYVLAVGNNRRKMKERQPGDGGEPSGIRDLGSLHYACRDTSMAWFAKYLESTVLSRPVADKTGLSGTYDFDVSWRPDETQFRGRFAGSKEAQSDLPDLFTALKDIGLKLEPAKSALQFLRIDHAERPSAN